MGLTLTLAISREELCFAKSEIKKPPKRPKFIMTP
jgi:hypothetical protein